MNAVTLSLAVFFSLFVLLAMGAVILGPRKR